MTLKKNYGPLAKGMVAFSSLIPIEFFLATVRFFLFRLGAFARTKNGRILSKNMREVKQQSASLEQALGDIRAAKKLSVG